MAEARAAQGGQCGSTDPQTHSTLLRLRVCICVRAPVQVHLCARSGDVAAGSQLSTNVAEAIQQKLIASSPHFSFPRVHLSHVMYWCMCGLGHWRAGAGHLCMFLLMFIEVSVLLRRRRCARARSRESPRFFSFCTRVARNMYPCMMD